MERSPSLEQIQQCLRQHLPQLAKEYHVHSLGIFGSYARKEQQVGSDLDLLVTFSEPPSLWEFIELEHILSDLLEVEVDLVMREGLKPRLAQQILQEVVTL